MKKAIILLFLSICCASYSNVQASCTQDAYGGQCVAYVRNYFGGSYSSMPGLCYVGDRTCSAYNAWGNWDLGYGSGTVPYNNSIMVMDHANGQPHGHVNVIVSVNNNQLFVRESNWDFDEKIDCNVSYTFYPETSEVSRNSGSRRYPVLGFIYGEEPIVYSAQFHSQDEYPSSVVPGNVYEWWIEFQNTGTETWYKNGNNPVRLGCGTYSNNDQYYNIAHDTWTDNYRPALMSQNSVAPGEVARFSFSFRVPENAQPGESQNFNFTPVAENICWMRNRDGSHINAYMRYIAESNQCRVEPVVLNESISSYWGNTCTSSNRSGSYAKYYSFSLSSSTDVKIDLESSTDTYLFLLQGNGVSGSEIQHNDDSGGTRNSCLELSLSSGTYTIEATTYSSRATGNFTLSLSSQDDAIIEPVAMNQSQNSSWSANIASTHRSGCYARYYSFTLSSSTSVRIDLESSTDTYLYLLQGNNTSGRVIQSNDDSGGTRNSCIETDLSSGTYIIESTTYSDMTTGNFTISLRNNITEVVEPISMNESINNSWSGDTVSTHRSGKYARYYTFTLNSSASVSIYLVSSTDPYLYLLQGNGADGSIIDSDDDSAGNRNSLIERNLSAGTYTIEATTYASGASGSFTVSLINNSSSIESIAINQSKNGSWSSDCESTHRSGRYARYYSFTLNSSRSVRIDLESDTDTYLYLINGNGTEGDVIDSNDDFAGSYNSRIERNLSSGTYTIEATTFSSGATGGFTLTLQ